MVNAIDEIFVPFTDIYSLLV